MTLILRMPTLQTHSVLKYGAWRQVIADQVASTMSSPTTIRFPA